MGEFTRVKSPMNFHGGFYPSGNTLNYKMTHWLFTLFQIISNILTSSLLTFSVIYTFYFYIAFEELTFYQKCSIKCVLYSLFYSFITSLDLTDDSVHYFSSSPFKTCFHSKTKTALHQWLQNSISLMNFLLITSCSHCRINIWNIPATMLHTSYHYHWFQPTEETFTFTFLMLAYLTQAPFSFLQ